MSQKVMSHAAEIETLLFCQPKHAFHVALWFNSHHINIIQNAKERKKKKKKVVTKYYRDFFFNYMSRRIQTLRKRKKCNIKMLINVKKKILIFRMNLIMFCFESHILYKLFDFLELHAHNFRTILKNKQNYQQALLCHELYFHIFKQHEINEDFYFCFTARFKV